MVSKRRAGATGLFAARRFCKLSQARLAKLAGLSQGTIWDLEHGRNKAPSFDKVDRLLRVLRRHGLPELTAGDLFELPELPEDA